MEGNLILFEPLDCLIEGLQTCSDWESLLLVGMCPKLSSERRNGLYERRPLFLLQDLQVQHGVPVATYAASAGT